MSAKFGLVPTAVSKVVSFKFIYICLFILDPVGPMIQRHLQEKVHAFVTTSSSSRSPTLSHNLVWHIVQQSIHEGQPDQLTRGPHSKLEERRLNTNKPHSHATTTRQTTHGRSTADNVQITLPNQSDSNIASEGAPEYRTPFNWTHTCYAIHLQIPSLARHSDERACCRPRPGRSCSPKRN